MNTKNCIICCILFMLVVHTNHALAECGHTYPIMPFCKGWMCTTECWMEAKLIAAKVMEDKCVKGGIKGYCYCRFCR
ncbi:hypothetical protein BDA96_06G019000 [Sorghum bicolor]|uniref:Knottin scorpion toxin-like domain-containing protein n=2 Tax=Sorghum bicolor TaxID=4558 RepID=A0A921QNL3_SORBI|nr:hypothetical protein BDA96_06G019000 [Sorghum bicolor]KXG25825.1 hypothetical protein SORBI_3006G017700 [Sorghum bicolor]